MEKDGNKYTAFHYNSNSMAFLPTYTMILPPTTSIKTSSRPKPFKTTPSVTAPPSHSYLSSMSEFQRPG